MFVNHVGQWRDFSGMSGLGRNHTDPDSGHRYCWRSKILPGLPCKRWCRSGAVSPAKLSRRRWSSWRWHQVPCWPIHSSNPLWPHRHLTPPCHNLWIDFHQIETIQMRELWCSWQLSATKPLKLLLQHMPLHLNTALRLLPSIEASGKRTGLKSMPGSAASLVFQRGIRWLNVRWSWAESFSQVT